MKKFSIAAMFSLLFFTCTEVKAQYIPDSNFAYAISFNCPTCIDSNHYLTADAQTLTSLGVYFGFGVTDLTGLDGFTNLQKFICGNLSISVFPAVPPNLDTLIIVGCGISTLPAVPFSLRYLDCSDNLFTSLPALPPALTYLNCRDNGLHSLPSLPSTLQYLDCSYNPDTILPTLPASLTYLNCYSNDLTWIPSLPISLTYLNIANNELDSLGNLPPSLEKLYCADNYILMLPPLPASLSYLDCSWNWALPLPPLPPSLVTLNCSVNFIEHLPSLPNSLRYLNAEDCALLDVPLLPDSLIDVDLSNNTITSLPNIPLDPNSFVIENNPISCLPHLPSTLTGIDLSGTNITCLPNIPAGFDNYNNLPLCEVGNLNGCFDNPTIRGNVYGDFNTNGAFDINEYHAGNIIVASKPGNFFGITDTSGNYFIAVPPGSTDTTTVSPINIYYNPPTTIYTVTFDTTGGQESLNNNFGVTAVTNGSNLEVNITSQFFHPGFSTNLSVTIKNVGTDNLDGTADLVFDPLLTFVSADLGGSQSGNIVTWSISSLHPFQTITFTATVNCPSSAVIGTILNNSVSGTVSGETDIDLANNSQSISSNVVGSYDPNDKEVSDATITPDDLANGKYLEYTIHFQNTGTAPATFINVVDTLSDKLDASSFEMIAASHQYEVTLTNDLTKTNHPVFVKWLFNNIQLPDSSVDFAGSQGFVKFRIRPKNDLLIGDQIQNTAGIYFDFNASVLTNTAITNVVLENGIANVNDDFFRATAYPNPVANTTTIHFDHVTSPQLSFQITDEVGSVVMEKIISVPHESFDVKLDVKKFHSGVYVITVKSLNGIQVMKLVKE